MNTKCGTQGLKNIIALLSIDKGPIIRSLAHLITCDNQARIAFISDEDVPISLGILELDIVVGLMLFDKIVFKHQGLYFGRSDDKVIPADLRYQRDCFSVMAVAVEVGPNPFFKGFGLAYVDNVVPFIFKKITAGCVRQYTKVHHGITRAAKTCRYGSRCRRILPRGSPVPRRRPRHRHPRGQGR